MIKQRIVAAVDGSDRALEAVRWAACEALSRRGSTLRIVAARMAESTHVPVEGFSAVEYQRAVLADAEDRLDVAESVARGISPDLTVERESREGSARAVLLDESTRADLVVLGHRGHGGFVGLLLGSVAVSVAAHASCPVVVVRQPGSDVSGDRAPVVVGVDGSPTSETALGFAFDVAARRHVPLVAVHTWFDLAVEPELVAMIDLDAVLEQERELLAQRLAGWSEKYPNVEIRRHVARDQPAWSLVEQSGDAGLVVVGARGRGVIAGTLLGSVSQAVLHHAKCPVAVVRPTPDHA
ncbi:universal stress protein [Pseudonocardia eucalypti]|uniref:Universal stress protein n=1 Tax=Pseudonocardia eucalypti TaxID=648755 RepID=A0ABP9QHX6_9PSEU|nr:nucleotide-binding universal stress UspA family protein [Pseudonocardia eucalypti]